MKRIRASGMALVAVLAVMVLFAALALAVFYTARFERRSSSLFAGSIEARTLAETGVNLCIAQIGDATSQSGRAWASQPGLIRTFTGNRSADVNYRLYSWSDMRPSGDFDPFSVVNKIPGNWESQKALYVDLNEPVPDLSDPGNHSKDKYPILYPPDLTTSPGGENVVGYSLDNAPGGNATSGNAVPMPVQWLYVLNDGSIHPATAGGSDASVKVAAATVQNPIVGRVAFWADDESAKININTAAGGRFWTPPWLQSADEKDNATGPIFSFGFSQPVKNEFQRYPGHPARTDLRAVFPEMASAVANDPWSEYYKLTPRILEGGSRNGRTKLSSAEVKAWVDADRLYAALGELNFATKKNNATVARNTQTAGFSAANPLKNDALWTDLVEKRKGFLTVTSRAPEMTLFGTPRVAIWPVHDSVVNRSALDKLAAFCSTLSNAGGGEYPYYFTRRNSLSATEDINLNRNKELFSYLQRLMNTPFPGASSGAFSSKYGGIRGRDQILTEIFDYIRSTNLQDYSLTGANQRFNNDSVVTPAEWGSGNNKTRGFGRTITVRQAGLLFICNADPATPASNRAPGEPLEPPPAPQDIRENMALDPYNADPNLSGKLQSNERRIQALFFVELFSPSAGFKQIMRGNNNLPVVKIRGLDSLAVGTTLTTPPVSLGFPATEQIQPKTKLASYEGAFGATGGGMNWRYLFMKELTPSDPSPYTYDARTTGGLVGESEKKYPFVSLPVTLKFDPNDPQFEFHGGNITVDIFDSGGQLLNSIPIALSDVTLPLPKLHPTDQQYWAFHKSGIYGDSSPHGRFFTDASRKGPALAADAEGLITQYDTAQTWILPHGDNRLSFRSDASGADFQPVPPTGPYQNLRHMLSESGVPVIGHCGDTLLSGQTGLPLTGSATPVLFQGAAYPASLNKPWTFMDWDTGSPRPVTDGPLINKTDEGTIMYIDGNRSPYSFEYNEGESQTPVYHSANRQIPSAVMFGSLPTGLIGGQPWQTLLFRPDPTGLPPDNPDAHPGAQDPPDHLLLDLFWMPVVEPYAISEPFSTAGKINMNYQMIPFTYIHRPTGMHALLMDEEIYAIPSAGWTEGYGKTAKYVDKLGVSHFSLPIDVEETLKSFDQKFAEGQVFLTPSEITTQYLVPQGQTIGGMPGFWAAHALTGENIRERAYATLYPRLTTQSNVFNIHYRAQALRKVPGTPPDEWQEDKDKILAEQRGNAIIERYVDMNSNDLPDFAINTSAHVGSLYRFRVLTSQKFNP